MLSDWMQRRWWRTRLLPRLLRLSHLALLLLP
jgi:hypothetical protein|eukprot:COSAG06_NODE_4869_length_3890_cov_346.413084_4_plen_32_part_00